MVEALNTGKSSDLAGSRLLRHRRTWLIDSLSVHQTASSRALRVARISTRMPSPSSEFQFGLGVASTMGEDRAGGTSIDAALLGMLRISRVGMNGTRAVIWWRVTCVLIRIRTRWDGQAATMTRAVIEA